MHSGDALLLERWREGRDAQAFAELAARYAGLVYAACRRILGNDTEAEDVAQDCFLSLAQKAPRKPQPLGPWLYVVATNSALNRRKSQARRVAREQRYAEQSATQAEPDWDDVQEYVDEAIAALPEKLREPIVLHFLEGRSQAAVAEMLGLPRTTVTARIARGIEETRGHLKRRGISIGAGALTGMLAAKSSVAAPAALTAALGKLALAGTQGAAGGAAIAVAGGAAFKLGVAGGVLVLIVAAAAFVFNLQPQKRNPGRASTAVSAAAPSAIETAEADWALPSGDRPPVNDTALAAADVGAGNATTDTLIGAVVDETGAPVDGAEVVVGVGEMTTALAQSDAEGRFRFEGLPPGPFVLHAFKPAVGLASLAEVPGQGDAGVLTLEPLGSISGRVYDKATGKGIANLEFSLLQYLTQDDLLNSACRLLESLKAEHENIKTDDAGSYRVPNLIPAKYSYWGKDTGSEYVLPGFHDMPREVVLGQGENLMGVDLPLERGGSISGTVFDEAGVPLEKAGVSLSPGFHTYYPYTPATTGADGSYRFVGLPTGESYSLEAGYEGYARVTSKPVALVDTAGVTGADIHLTVGYTLAGKVVEEDGTPVAGADVTCEGARSDWSDEQGRFKLEHVAPGEYVLSVRERGGDYPIAFEKFAMPAKDVLDLVVTVSRGTPGVISGRVVNSGGEPLHDVRVEAYSDTSTPGDKHVSEHTETDEQGRFEFKHLGDAVTCAVDAYPGNYAFVRQHRVPVGTTDLELVVKRFGSLSGNVVDAATGEPITDYQIRFSQYRPGEFEDEREYFDNQWMRMQAVDGAFRLPNVAPSATRLEVTAKGFAPEQTERIEVAEGGNVAGVVVKLSRGARLEGKVVDERTGKPVPGVRVRAYSPTWFNSMLLTEWDNLDVLNLKTCISTMAGGDGRFVLDPFTPGEKVGVVAWHDGYATQILPLVVVGKGAVPLDIRLAPEGRLVVRVENAHVIDARVLTWCRQVDGAYQGDSGTEWRGLPAGQYEVVIQTPDSRQLGVLSAEVAAGETTEVVADLATAGAAFGSIYGVIELGWASVHVSPAGSERTMYAYGYTDESGMFRIGGLPPGEYEIRANGSLDGQDYEGQARVLVEAGQEREVQIEMQPAVHPALR